MRRVGFVMLLSVLVGAAPCRAQVHGPLPQGQVLEVSQDPAPPVVTGAPARAEADRVPADDGEAPTEPPFAASEGLPLGTGRQDSVRERLLGAGDPLADEDAAAASAVTDGWWRTALSLGFVVALVLVLGACFRRWAATSGGLALGGRARAPSGVVSVLARYPVARGQQLVLLRVDRRVLVLHQSGAGRAGQMRTLADMCDPEEVASIIAKTTEAEGASVGAGFREVVKRMESGPRVVEHEPVVLEGVPVGEPDPVDSLQSRLATLRRAHAEVEL